MPLPAELTEDRDSHRFTIWFGDDIEGAERDDVLAQTWLRIAYTGNDGSDTQIMTTLNDRTLRNGHCVEGPGHSTIVYRDLSVVQGERGATLICLLRSQPGPLPIRDRSVAATQAKLTGGVRRRPQE